MSSAAKGMAGLVVALAVIAGVATWILRDDGGAHSLSRNGQTAAANGQAALADPAAAKAGTDAQRAAETTETPAPAEAESVLPPGTPIAEFLTGVVVDSNGQPVANADIAFAPTTFVPRSRGGRNLRIRPPGVKDNSEIPATLGHSAADGSFKLSHVPRVDGLELTVDHPDYIYMRKSGLVLPTKGLDLGRITLDAGGAVSGQVFGPGGAKLANAEVWLNDAPDANNNNPFNFRMFGFGQTRGERKATTDEQGHFRLSGMPAGKCLVAAKSSDCPEGESAPLELKVHEEVANVVVNLEAGDRITGTVKGPDGKPVADAEIHINQNGRNSGRGMNIRFGGQRNPFEPDTTTDTRGHFELKGLKRGVFDFTVDAKGFAVKDMAEIDSSAATPLDITLGAGTHVAGVVRIKDSPEAPKNVKVQLTPVWGDNIQPISLDFPDTDNVATQDGSFVIPDVDPGKYRVVARGENTSRGSSETIEVVDGQNIENIEVTVERGAIIMGRVVDAATGAPVGNADVEAATIPQADPNAGGNGRSVNVAVFGGPRGGRRFAGGGGRQAVGRAKSDADGKYELKGLPAGQFTVDARHPDYAALRSAPIDVKSGEVKEGNELRLLRGGAIEGTVTGIDGKPRTGDKIDVTSKSIEGVTLNAVSDATGSYRVEHVPAGDGVVQRSEADANTPGRPTFRMSFAGAGGPQDDPGKPYTMKEADLVRIDFAQQEKPWVEGFVRSVEGPVAGATVVALPGDGSGGRRGFFGMDQKSATTGADGSYRLADLDPGAYRIQVRHPQGIVPVQQPVELKSGEPAHQDFFLEGGVIEGTVAAQKNHTKLEGAVVTIESVKDDAANQNSTVAFTTGISLAFSPGGRGRRGGAQTFFSSGGPSRSQVMTDASGHFRVPWVPSGKWKVSASHGGFLPAQSEAVELAANAKVDNVALELAPAAQLVVHVKSKGTGLAMAGTPVELSTEDGGHEFRMTDEEGAATFESLKPGTWTVSGKKTFNSDDSVKKTVETPADRKTEVTLDV